MFTDDSDPVSVALSRVAVPAAIFEVKTSAYVAHNEGGSAIREWAEHAVDFGRIDGGPLPLPHPSGRWAWLSDLPGPPQAVRPPLVLISMHADETARSCREHLRLVSLVQLTEMQFVADQILTSVRTQIEALTAGQSAMYDILIEREVGALQD